MNFTLSVGQKRRIEKWQTEKYNRNKNEIGTEALKYVVPQLVVCVVFVATTTAAAAALLHNIDGIERMNVIAKEQWCFNF